MSKKERKVVLDIDRSVTVQKCYLHDEIEKNINPGTNSTHRNVINVCTPRYKSQTLKTRALERPGCRWENTIKMSLEEIGIGLGPNGEVV